MGFLEPPLKRGKREFQVILRISKEEYFKIHESAGQYSDGCISSWLRYAAIMFKPDKASLELLPKIRRIRKN
jgi:hypothetical protein